jgi:hypothetical protein
VNGVGIAQWYSAGLHDRGFEFREGLGIFLFTTVSRPDLGHTQSPIQWVPEALSLGMKQPGREADHSPPSSAEDKNAWSYTPLLQYAFMAWCSVKAQDSEQNWQFLEFLRSLCDILTPCIRNIFVS